MIPTSDAYKVIVQTPGHSSVCRAQVLLNDIVVAELNVHDGQVDFDRNANVVRRFDCLLTDPTGALTPQGVTDILAPFGTVIKLSRGVKIPHIDRVSVIVDSQADWAAGTRVGTSAADDGSLVLGTT